MSFRRQADDIPTSGTIPAPIWAGNSSWLPVGDSGSANGGAFPSGACLGPAENDSIITDWARLHVKLK